MHAPLRSSPTRHARIGGWRFQAWIAVAMLAGFVVHEAAHAVTGWALGYRVDVGLNHVEALGATAADALLVTAAGPAVTLLTALVALGIVRRRGGAMAYAVVYTAWFMRLAALAVSIAHPNDEARMSLAMGWNMWVLPSLVVALLLWMTVLASRRLRVRWTANVGAYLTCSAITALIVFVAAL